MNRETFQSKVNKLVSESGISVNEAVKRVEEQYMIEVEQRLRREEEKRNEAAISLLNNPESKTIIVPVHEFILKEKAMAIAHSTIKVNKFHFISGLVHGEKDTWLVASEFPVSQADALIIIENLTLEKYSDDEIEVIVTKHVPFDLR